MDSDTLQKKARQNAAQDEAFREYLKTRLPLSNNALDAVVKELTEEVWAKIDCTTCGNCCRTLQIVVDRKDAARLARRFGISTQAFIEQYLAVADDGIGYFRDSPPCPFLGDDNRCQVYDDRPQACRDFPYLTDRNFRSRSLTMVESCGTCPIVFDVWEGLKQRFPLPMADGSAPRPPGRRQR